MTSVVHACPPGYTAVTPCCGRSPFELPRTSRMTVDPELVTCGIDAVIRDAAAQVDAAHQQLREARRLLYWALDRRALRPGRQPALHGTPAGYRRHQRAHDLACQACLAAYTWDTTRRRHARSVS